MTAFIFDMDGTLSDTVYAHVLAWHRALLENGIEVPAWRVHRRIGMSGGLLMTDFAAETGVELTDDVQERLNDAHARYLDELRGEPRLLPGANELLEELTERDIDWAIATSSRPEAAQRTIETLGLPEGAIVVTRADVARAKPEPDLFFASAERLGAEPRTCYAVGDSTWDMVAGLRAGMTGIGLLTGGYSADELERAGAAHVFEDPAKMTESLDDVLGDHAT
ncbi:MAG: HAD family hydrolase [Actinomycetota bacterium]